MHQLPQKKGGRASIYDEFTKATENRKVYNNYIYKIEQIRYSTFL